jgi:adenylate cyclase
MLFRIGINLGDVVHDETRIYGDGINVAACLEALAAPGGVFVSHAVHEQVRDRLALAFEDLGERELKNIARPVRVYRLQAPGTPTAAPASAATLTLPAKPSIAVLPFDNMSGDPEQGYLADGIAEDTVTALSRLRWLFVIARNSSFTYKGRHVDVRQVGRDLGVRYVLEGSVRKGGNRIRVNAQLIEAATGNHLWAERYDRPLDDVFAIQDEITGSVVTCIQPEVYAAEHERLKRTPPHRLDAWESFVRAMFLYSEHSDASSREAVALLDRAVQVEPGYARAHGLRAVCLVCLPGLARFSGLGGPRDNLRPGRRRRRSRRRHRPRRALGTSRPWVHRHREAAPRGGGRGNRPGHRRESQLRTRPRRARRDSCPRRTTGPGHRVCRSLRSAESPRHLRT